MDKYSGRLTLFVILFEILSLLCQIAGTSTSDRSSCRTKCIDKHSSKGDKNQPLCDIWHESDNLHKLTGIYILEKSSVEFKCAVMSLPEPADVTWYFQRHSNSAPERVHCTKRRTVTECNTNSRGEHRVTSHCALKLDSIQLTGYYYCQGRAKTSQSMPDSQGSLTDIRESSIHSDKAHIQVYGIHPFKVIDSYLHHGAIGHVTVELCAHPPPEISWIRTHDTRILLKDGASDVMKGYAVSDLKPAVFRHPVQLHSNNETSSTDSEFDIIKDNQDAPSAKRRFCYTSQLIIAKVDGNKAKYWTLVVSNNVEIKQTKIKDQLTVKVPSYLRKSATRHGVYSSLTVLLSILVSFWFL